MDKKSIESGSFRKGYLRAIEDCEKVLRELGFHDAKEIMDDLRKTNH